MSTLLPGLNPRRLANLMRLAIRRTRLDLNGAVVVTEAATRAYAVTPILASLAGAAKVYAIAQETRYGSVQDVIDQTNEIASAARAPRSIEIVTELSRSMIAQADVVTNSGHVRPIHREMIALLKPTAVVPLMYESWEFRETDVDLEACRDRGIAVAGTNERHPEIDVFSYLGIMAVKLLLDCGVAVYKSQILLLCDNPFESYIRRGLLTAGAHVKSVDRLTGDEAIEHPDAIVVALQPKADPVVGRREVEWIAERYPGVVVAQYWGDLDRGALDQAGVAYWPERAPALGHMGVLPSDVGPEPIVRLQIGGLKVAEVLLGAKKRKANTEWEYVDAYK